MKTYIKILSLVLIVITISLLYTIYNSTYIAIRFTELRPLHHCLPVYYKGIVIGKTGTIKPSEDYKYTILKVRLYGRNHKLPKNCIACLKKEVRGKRHIDYIELCTPDIPDSEFIKTGSLIEGKSAFDLEDFLRNQETEHIEGIKENLSNATENLNNSLETLSQLFTLVEDVVSENRVNIKNSINNLERSTKNISNSSSKINQLISEEQLSEIIANLEKTTASTYNITENISETGVVGVSELITKANCILDDTQSITHGIRSSMGKQFSGLRLLFGKVIEE